MRQRVQYTLAKYKGAGKAVRMKGIVPLGHPKPPDEAQAALWKRLLENRPEMPLTWETELSAKGNSKQTWKKLIDSGKAGYMALLRNIIQAASANISKAWKTIGDEDAV